MNEGAINRHSFELAKNRLKEFSEITEAELEINKVQTEGDFFGLGEHRVTGDELNKRLESIQEHFIAVNTTSNKVIKEFREIYNALDAIDKDYIASIVANVKAIEKTSNDVRTQQRTLKQHNEKLATQQSKLDVHQTEIEKNIADISKIITVLKVFKEKLEGYKHLKDVDKIWNDYKRIQNEIRVVSDSITMFSKKVSKDIATANKKNEAFSDQVNRDILALCDDVKTFKEFCSDLSEKLGCTENLLNNQIPIIQEMTLFAEHLKNSAHIDDVDSMWDDLDVCKAKIDKINENIQIEQNKLNTLFTTSAEHKESIDALFKNLSDTEKYAVDSRNLITGLEQDVIAHAEKLNELVQANDRICKSIDSNARDVNILKEYKNKLGQFSHLEDVDSIWRSVEEHTSRLTESEKKDAELAAAIQHNKEEVDKKIADTLQTADTAVEFITKKVKCAYWVAGGSAGLAILEFILLLTKVI